MYVASPRLITGFALAILSLLASTRHVVVSKDIEPIHAEKPPPPEYYSRHGDIMSAYEAYGILNKWVVHLRKPDLPPDPPKNPVRGTQWYDRTKVALGYGLYFRAPGFMLTNIKNIIEGSKLTARFGRVIEGHYVHYNEKSHYAPIVNASAPVIYLPYTLTDIKHVMTFSGTDLGVIRVNMNDYKEQFTPANGQPPYERHMDYPGDKYMPDIAKPETNFTKCYVVIHSEFHEDKMGYNEYAWRFFAVRARTCEGPICTMEAISDSTQWSQFALGNICNTTQDMGAPILCHTEGKNWQDKSRRYGEKNLNRFDGYWKLKYMVARASTYDGCSQTFYALDLAYWRSTILDPGWLQFLEGGVW